ARDLRQMIHMGPELEWTPPVVSTTAASGEGLEGLWGAIDEHRAHLEAEGGLRPARRARLLREVEGLVAERLRARARDALAGDDALGGDLLERRIDPYRAAAILTQRIAAAP
ncbi:MAG TPA: methylmalonyl Co-A mutase-associated GTPase MeaB, partial [Actinomycetota bacterium]